MSKKRYLEPDLLAGLFFFTIATIGLWLSSAYPIGTLTDMGPGYFPFALSMLLLPVALVITAKAIVSPVSNNEEIPISARATVAILAATVLFALLVDRIGLFLSSFIVITVGSFGYNGYRWKEVAFVALIMAICCVLLFITILSLPISTWPRW